MAKGFETNENNTMLYYILEHPIFVQRKMASDLGWNFGARVNSFVNWLLESKVIRRTLNPETEKPAYEVVSRASLLEFYSRFRKMSEEKIFTRKIGHDYKTVIKYLNENGAIMCLTTALNSYSDYFRDREIHAYAKNRNLVDMLSNQEEGEIQVNLYAYDFLDDPKILDGIKVTSPVRTIMDLYCNNMAYAADELKAEQWRA